MDRSRIHVKNTLARIGYVPRQASPVAERKQPVDYGNDFPAIPNINGHSLDHGPPELYPHNTRTQPNVQKTHYENYKPRAETLSTLSVSNEYLTNVRQVKDSNSGIKSWYRHSTPGKQTLVKALLGILALTVVAAAVLVPVYFLVIAPQTTQTTYSSTTTTTTTTMYVCSSTTCIGQETPYQTTTLTALYPFDGTFSDISGYYPGVTYGAGTVTATAAGYFLQALSLSSTNNQYVQIPNFSFVQKSFTVEIWIYPPSSLVGFDYGMFGQCDVYNVCLSISLRNGRIVASIDSMNATGNTLTGSTLFSSGGYYWYHVAIVYDMTLYQLRIYVNGRVDAVSSGAVSPYRGVVSGLTTTTIGRSSTFAFGTTYFNGRIDMVTISAGTARTACQVLNDASLVAYYPFDTAGALTDYSANLCNGYAYSVSTVSSGRIGQAISFNLSSSYFQSLCFPHTRPYDISYTYSLWINPTSLTGGGTLLHLSTATNGGGPPCIDALALTTTGNIVVQWAVTSSSAGSAQGPVIPVNTWTHVAVVYSSNNGIRLFVNGQISVILSTTIYEINQNVFYMTLGNVGILGPSGATGCLIGSTPVVSGVFPGAIDTFRLYNRELTAQEICVLANP